MNYKFIEVPQSGEKISYDKKTLQVPSNPYVGFIEGDGIGPDIWSATQNVVDAAVQKAYSGERKISWVEIYAGEKSHKKTGEWLPEETIDFIKEYKLAIKGPLATPVGGGMRSLNVGLRKKLDLYACVRPCKWYTGVPAPVAEPQKVNMTIFRENTEDIYAGAEWEAGSEAANEFLKLAEKHGKPLRPGSAIGLKPMSEFGSKRLIKKALDYALENKSPSVTLVHKGNIMKFTEGAFKDWGYELAEQEYPGKFISEQKLWDEFDGKCPEGQIILKDRIADNMFQQALLRPNEYSVLALPNLNGDYMSDALAAQVGGLGIAPGGNVGDGLALFEATHGTAPKYIGQDKVNPGSLILSAVMMLDYMGWGEAADSIEKAMAKAIVSKRVTYDFHRHMEGATLLKCSEFGEEIIKNF